MQAQFSAEPAVHQAAAEIHSALCALKPEPIGLLQPGEVLLKRFGNRSKYEPAVDTVELLEATPTYAHVKFKDGHEDTVALRHLAPCPSQSVKESVEEAEPFPNDATEAEQTSADAEQFPNSVQLTSEQASVEEPAVFDGLQPRRSSRERKPVDRFSPS